MVKSFDEDENDVITEMQSLNVKPILKDQISMFERSLERTNEKAP